MFKSDQEIIDAIQSGNRKDEAFKWIYKEGKVKVRQLGFNYHYTQDDCDDVLQEAVIVFWKNLLKPDFKLTCRIMTYMHTICENKFKNKKRDAKEVATIEVNSMADSLEDEVMDEENYSFNISKITECLMKLGERCRSLITEFYAGTSMKVLATKYAYSNTETATSQKHRCMNQLKEKVKSL